MNNLTVHVASTIIRNVVLLVSEAELEALHLNEK